MAHKNDVIFTEQGLVEFIQQIRQNPEMVYKVRAATDEEITQHNETHPTLAEGRIPGKGITIIQANGDKFSVAVGSDVKAPNFETEVKNNILFGNGTVTFIVDESYINIPIKGVVNVIDEDNDEIPNSFAVKDFVNEEFENFREELDGMLNGDLGQEGYGFIPGYYTSVNKILEEDQKTTLNNNLKTLEITSQNGVYSSSSGVVFSNNIIAKPNELLSLINNKKVELQNTKVLQEYNQLLKEQQELEQEKISLEQNTQILVQELEELATQKQNLNSDLNNYTSVKDQGEQTLKNILINTLHYPSNISYDVLLDKLNSQSLLLVNLKLFTTTSEITSEKISNLKEQYYNPENAEYVEKWNALQLWEDIYYALELMQRIEEYTKKINDIENSIKEIDTEVEPINNQKENNNIKISALEEQISILQGQLNSLQNEVNIVNNKINTIIPATIALIDAGANRTWTVIKTQSTSNHEIASLKADKVYGAVYNDYAEYRNTVDANPGHVVIENGDGSLSLAKKRLQLGANIISDTYGFAIGETNSAQTPIAVCGRVLA